MGHKETTDCTSDCTPCEDYDKLVDEYAEQPSFAPEDLNQQLSFPYPKMEGPKRPPGNGCVVCVHQGYCPALYWFKRYTQEKPDEYNGVQCASWSTDKADQVLLPNDFDLEENARRACEGILKEPTGSGITVGGGRAN
jgi:hypothetical protein